MITDAVPGWPPSMAEASLAEVIGAQGGLSGGL